MLKFIRVSKQFLDDRPALDNVSFDIEKGELVLITGPSGSGKTTLLKLITKELEPTEGEIFFGEQDLGSLKRSKIPYHRRKIGAVFQDYKLLPELNVWENIALALSILGHPDHEIEEKVTDLLKLVGLTDKAYLFPHQLSGGEAQRISIARALSTAPQVIFADEPTGNLDSANSLTVAKLLKKINELGTTVIVTTHDPVVIKYLGGVHKMTIENGVLVDEKLKGEKDEVKKIEENKEKPAKIKETEDVSADNDKEEIEVEEKEEEAEVKDEEKAKKPAKHWGFFGIFKRPSTQVKAEKEKEDDDEEDEDHKIEVSEVDLETKPERVEVESEDLDDDDDDDKEKPKKHHKHHSKAKHKKKED